MIWDTLFRIKDFSKKYIEQGLVLFTNKWRKADAPGINPGQAPQIRLDIKNLVRLDKKRSVPVGIDL